MSRQEVPRAGLVKAALAGTITNPEGARQAKGRIERLWGTRNVCRHGSAVRWQPSPSVRSGRSLKRGQGERRHN